MNNMSYLKSELRARIQANRDRHRKIFDEAMEGYRAEAIKRLQHATTQIAGGKVPDFYSLVRLPVPQDHTGDYDAVLDMLDLSTGDEIEMDEGDFRSYVRDEWSWKKEFIGTASNYTVV